MLCRANNIELWCDCWNEMSRTLNSLLKFCPKLFTATNISRNRIIRQVQCYRLEHWRLTIANMMKTRIAQRYIIHDYYLVIIMIFTICILRIRHVQVHQRNSRNVPDIEKWCRITLTSRAYCLNSLQWSMITAIACRIWNKLCLWVPVPAYCIQAAWQFNGVLNRLLCVSPKSVESKTGF